MENPSTLSSACQTGGGAALGCPEPIQSTQTGASDSRLLSPILLSGQRDPQRGCPLSRPPAHPPGMRPEDRPSREGQGGRGSPPPPPKVRQQGRPLFARRPESRLGGWEGGCPPGSRDWRAGRSPASCPARDRGERQVLESLRAEHGRLSLQKASAPGGSARRAQGPPGSPGGKSRSGAGNCAPLPPRPAGLRCPEPRDVAREAEPRLSQVRAGSPAPRIEPRCPRV